MGERDRRRDDRYRLWLPVAIEGAGPERVYGVAHDISQSGALLVTAEELVVGSQVVVDTQWPPGEGERWSLPSEVLRCSRNDLDPDGLWPFRAALQFRTPHPDLVMLLSSNSEGRRAATEQLARTDDS